MPTIAELFTLAVQYHQGGHLAQAEPLYRQILQAEPAHAESLHLLGLLAHQTGHPEAALELIRQAIALTPSAEGPQFNLGIVLMSQRQFPQAAAAFQNALQLNPHNARAHFNLGMIFKNKGLMTQAAECFQQAMRCQPNYPEALNNLGIILRDQGKLDQAVQCYRQALHFDPNRADACNNLGNALKDQGNFNEAMACFQQALRINPNSAEAYTNLGLAFKDHRKFIEASAAFQNALAINPGHSPALWNRCLLRLLQGDFAGGWPDHEQRWAQPGIVPRTFKQPRWDGSPLHGKTILMYAEMGLGDTIHFLRFVPMVKQRGGIVVLECQPALVKLFAGFPGVDQIVPTGAPLPPFDVEVPLLSLPSVFGTTLATIPAQIPYLSADPKRIKRWQKEIARLTSFNSEPTATADLADNMTLKQETPTTVAVGSGLTIGIAWHSNPEHTCFNHKSFPLACFEPLAHVDRVRLLSLQVGPATKQIETAKFPVIDLGSSFDQDSLEDLAAAMMNLDLVVTVDTAVAHLAGALGVPVWVALPNVACWRWLLEREDSPWYPTMRLFRQSKMNDWDDVFQIIAATVRAMLV